MLRLLLAPAPQGRREDWRGRVWRGAARLAPAGLVNVLSSLFHFLCTPFPPAPSILVPIPAKLLRSTSWNPLATHSKFYDPKYLFRQKSSGRKAEEETEGKDYGLQGHRPQSPHLVKGLTARAGLIAVLTGAWWSLHLTWRHSEYVHR